MPITTPPGEPVVSRWQVRPLDDVVAELLKVAGTHPGRPALIAVDGRSAGGKSTFAERLAAAVPGAVVVHTDDVAWWESFFDWAHLLEAGVLEPLRRGAAVRFRPPAWEARAREGAIEVAANLPLVIVEGVGASRRSLRPLFDAAVWVQSDAAEARRRGVERDLANGETEAFWDEWELEEQPFLAADRPWERADFVICGTPTVAGVPHDPARELLVGRLADVTIRPERPAD